MEQCVSAYSGKDVLGGSQWTVQWHPGALGIEVLHLDQAYVGTSPTLKKIPIVMLVGLQDEGL